MFQNLRFNNFRCLIVKNHFVEIECFHAHLSKLAIELQQSSSTKQTKVPSIAYNHNNFFFNRFLDMGITTSMHTCSSRTTPAGNSNRVMVIPHYLLKLSGMATTMCDNMTMYTTVKNEYSLQHSSPFLRQTNYSRGNSDNNSI